MGFQLNIKKGVPIPPQSRKGEDSEITKAMLGMEIGDGCHEFQEFTGATDENGKKIQTEESKALKYTANKLQKAGRARFSFRTGKNGELSKMWRVSLNEAPVEAAQA